MADERVLVYPDGPGSLPVEWDAEEYNADPEGVIREIKKQRAATQLSDDMYEPMPNYKELFGDDS